MSASRLREAASLLRERAEAATAGRWQLDGPFWWRGGDLNPDCTTVITAGVGRLSVVVLPEDRYRRETSDADSRWIATMQPAMARPLADWLEFVAVGRESLDAIAASSLPTVLFRDIESHALAVADAILEATS